MAQRSPINHLVVFKDDTILYNTCFALENWPASCKFIIPRKQQELKLF